MFWGQDEKQSNMSLDSSWKMSARGCGHLTSITMWGPLARLRGRDSLMISAQQDRCALAANKKHTGTHRHTQTHRDTHTPPGLSPSLHAEPCKAEQVSKPCSDSLPWWCSDRWALRAGFVTEPGKSSSGNTPGQQVRCTQLQEESPSASLAKPGGLKASLINPSPLCHAALPPV